jgi:hypothetical protein
LSKKDEIPIVRDEGSVAKKNTTTALEQSTNGAEAAIFLSGVSTASVSPLHNTGALIDRSVSFSKRE